ncbi:hypothetical protein N0Y54_37630 [Nostoc punctiforme UO1]|uniref:hypothetical protein n=1 Tax=Nostoc punctiforme TaxID=272131 RepID=UPI0030B30CFA
MSDIPSQDSLINSFMQPLACAAIAPSLHSILVYDTTPETLQLAALIIAQMLEVINGYKVDLVTLGTYEDEDLLWGNLGLSVELEQQSLLWKQGLLTSGQNNSLQQIVVIPDLTKLNLAALRGGVTLMGADVAHLERHGQQAQWQPKLFWIAGCAYEEVKLISPHLLDRFALRLRLDISKNTDRVAEILKLLDEQNSDNKKPLEALPDEIIQSLNQARDLHPQITDKALNRVIEYTNILDIYHRREIALARLSLAYARLTRSLEITAEHIDHAAQMVGLKPLAKLPKLPATLPNNNSSNPVNTTNIEPLPSPPLPSPLPNPTTKLEEILEPNKTEDSVSTILPLRASDNPYPEDEEQDKSKVSSLQLPIGSFRSKTVDRGQFIGVEKASYIQDIAFVRTLLEAAKYQNIRKQSTGNSQQQLILLPTDLYRYRRAPVAEQMLMLVLDHTCLENCNWQKILPLYLSWAYVERASICLIQVGAKNARHQLQAQKIMAQSLLNPRIYEGIYKAGKGKATPLAHGLNLALQTLRHSLEHGRSTVQQVLLVVISDGRGNVTLTASQTNSPPPKVKREGIEDALNIAKNIAHFANFHNIQAVLLNPQSKAYPDLPLELAEALGAKVVDIPSLWDTSEVEA